MEYINFSLQEYLVCLFTRMFSYGFIGIGIFINQPCFAFIGVVVAIIADIILFVRGNLFDNFK